MQEVSARVWTKCNANVPTWAL